MHPETRYKFCKIRENCARDMTLWGVYIPHFDQISVKIPVLGVLYPIVAPMGRNMACRRGPPSSMPNFTPIGAMCHPCGAKKTQNQPLSNLNNRRFALCAMLPVNCQCAGSVAPPPCPSVSMTGTSVQWKVRCQIGAVSTFWHCSQQMPRAVGSQLRLLDMLCNDDDDREEEVSSA